jgi:hypothetical protein
MCTFLSFFYVLFIACAVRIKPAGIYCAGILFLLFTLLFICVEVAC